VLRPDFASAERRKKRRPRKPLRNWKARSVTLARNENTTGRKEITFAAWFTPLLRRVSLFRDFRRRDSAKQLKSPALVLVLSRNGNGRKSVAGKQEGTPEDEYPAPSLRRTSFHLLHLVLQPSHLVMQCRIFLSRSLNPGHAHLARGFRYHLDRPGPEHSVLPQLRCTSELGPPASEPHAQAINDRHSSTSHNPKNQSMASQHPSFAITKLGSFSAAVGVNLSLSFVHVRYPGRHSAFGMRGIFSRSFCSFRADHMTRGCFVRQIEGFVSSLRSTCTSIPHGTHGIHNIKWLGAVPVFCIYISRRWYPVPERRDGLCIVGACGWGQRWNRAASPKQNLGAVLFALGT